MHVQPPLPLRLPRAAHHHMQRDLPGEPQVRQPPAGLARDLLNQAPLRQRIDQPPRRPSGALISRRHSQARITPVLPVPVGACTTAGSPSRAIRA